MTDNIRSEKIVSQNEHHKKRRGPGRPPKGSEDKGKRILAEATHLFAMKGYEATSLGSISRASGISKAGLLHHFPSKEHLLVEILEKGDVENMPHWDRLSSDPWHFLDEFAQAVEVNQQGKTIVKLYTSLSGAATNVENPAHRWLSKYLIRARTAFIQRFEHGKNIGTVSHEAPSEIIASLFVAASDGLKTQWLCSEEKNQNNSAFDMATHIRVLTHLVQGEWAIS